GPLHSLIEQEAERNGELRAWWEGFQGSLFSRPGLVRTRFTATRLGWAHLDPDWNIPELHDPDQDTDLTHSLTPELAARLYTVTAEMSDKALKARIGRIPPAWRPRVDTALKLLRSAGSVLVYLSGDMTAPESAEFDGRDAAREILSAVDGLLKLGPADHPARQLAVTLLDRLKPSQLRQLLGLLASEPAENAGRLREELGRLLPSDPSDFPQARQFLDDWADGGDRVAGLPEKDFNLAVISSELRELKPTKVLDRNQDALNVLRTVMAGQPADEVAERIIGEQGLTGVQAARVRWYLNWVTGRLAKPVRDHLSSAHPLSYDEQVTLVHDLLEGPAGDAALDLIEAGSPGLRDGLVRARWFRDLVAKIPAGSPLRVRADRILTPGEFSPDLAVPELAGLDITDPLTGDQAESAVARWAAAPGGFGGLLSSGTPPYVLDRLGWWEQNRLRPAVADRLLRFLLPRSRYDLTGQQEQMVRYLVTGDRLSRLERLAVVKTITEGTVDPAILFGPDGEFAAALDDLLPRTDDLRRELETFVGAGLPDLRRGVVQPGQQARQPLRYASQEQVRWLIDEHGVLNPLLADVHPERDEVSDGEPATGLSLLAAVARLTDGTLALDQIAHNAGGFLQRIDDLLPRSDRVADLVRPVVDQYLWDTFAGGRDALSHDIVVARPARDQRPPPGRELRAIARSLSGAPDEEAYGWLGLWAARLQVHHYVSGDHVAPREPEYQATLLRVLMDSRDWESALELLLALSPSGIKAVHAADRQLLPDLLQDAIPSRERTKREGMLHEFIERFDGGWDGALSGAVRSGDGELSQPGLSPSDLSVLKDHVSKELGHLTAGKRTSVDAADVAEKQEALPSDWKREPPKQRANAIARLILGQPLGVLKGKGSSVEGEYPYPMSHDGAPNFDDLRGVPFAEGPDGALVVFEVRRFYQGPGGKYYGKQRAAIDAGGSGDAVRVMIPEVLPAVAADEPAEDHRPGPDSTFALYEATESAFEDIRGEPGDPPHVPIEQVLTEKLGWTLTEEAKGWKIGPRPIGAEPGARRHHNEGVPLAVVHPYLRHVLQNTWDRAEFTRDHLADALDFADEIAARFIARRFLGHVPRDLGRVYDVLDIPDLAVQQLRGHVATLYVAGAMLVNAEWVRGLDKRHAAALIRRDPDELLASLPESAREYLGAEAAGFLEMFERRLRSRVPDLDDRYRRRRQELGRPADDPVRVLNLVPMRAGHTIGSFLASGLVTGYPHITKLDDVTTINVLSEPDDGGSVPKEVVEARAYGQRYADAATTRQERDTLVGVVNSLMPLARRLHDPTPEDRAEVRRAAMYLTG
ncbi:MAG: hypothetical protein ABSA93_40005, partial [Streptosporangiaceae bacterium]